MKLSQFNTSYIKNHLAVFFSLYLVIISTKFTFVLYLHDFFLGYTFQELAQSIFLGYQFDFAISAFIAFIATLFDFNKTLFSRVSSLLLVSIFAFQMSDIIYFNESNRHIAYEIKDALADKGSLFMTAYSQHHGLTVISLLVLPLLFILSIYFFKASLTKVSLSKTYFLNKISLFVLTIFFVRGMFVHIPLNPWQSSNIGDNKLSSASLNASYNILYILANSSKLIKYQSITNISDERASNIIREIYNTPKTKVSSHLNKPNVIFLFLESWSAVNLKSYGFGKSTTPFFDEILKKSIRPKGMIAGGHRTTEGIFSSLVSFQNPLGRSVAKTNLQDYHYTSIINILNEDGYNSAFFQGTAKQTSGTGAFVQKLGFKDSYGKSDIKTRKFKENSWGVYDQDLYHFTLEKISQLKAPFVIGINGATTHDHQIPQHIKELNYSDNESLNNKLNALNFSDVALQEFMNTIEHEYPNTLFILLADHCGSVKGSTFQNYLIPFAIYHKDLKPKYYDDYISQRDISPSILDLLYGDYHQKNNSFSGKSLISDSHFFADYYHNGTLGWIEGQKAMEVNIHTKKRRCYDISSYKDVEITCDKETEQFSDKALSFTTISQKLLFSGDTKAFNTFRN